MSTWFPGSFAITYFSFPPPSEVIPTNVFPWPVWYTYFLDPSLWVSFDSLVACSINTHFGFDDNFLIAFSDSTALPDISGFINFYGFHPFSAFWVSSLWGTVVCRGHQPNSFCFILFFGQGRLLSNSLHSDLYLISFMPTFGHNLDVISTSR